MQEIVSGKPTGQTLEVYISCMDDESMQTAIAEEYCVLGICEKQFAMDMGWIKEVSETDTGRADTRTEKH